MKVKIELIVFRFIGVRLFEFLTMPALYYIARIVSFNFTDIAKLNHFVGKPHLPLPGCAGFDFIPQYHISDESQRDKKQSQNNTIEIKFPLVNVQCRFVNVHSIENILAPAEQTPSFVTV